MAGLDLPMILVVDDEDIIRRSLERLLSTAGYKHLGAANGEDALRSLSEQEFGVILLDVRMPGLSGLEVLERVSETYPETSVIMVTAMADTETAIGAMRGGAYDYVIKPFNLDDILMKVQRSVERHQLKRQARDHEVQLRAALAEQQKLLQKQFVQFWSSGSTTRTRLRRTATRTTMRSQRRFSIF